MPQVLQDITILDFTRGMPGAIATMVCSDFGAQVIKIHWHGGYDEDLDQVEGPSWTVDVLLMGEASRPDFLVFQVS